MHGGFLHLMPADCADGSVVGATMSTPEFSRHFVERVEQFRCRGRASISCNSGVSLGPRTAVVPRRFGIGAGADHRRPESLHAPEMPDEIVLRPLGAARHALLEQFGIDRGREASLSDTSHWRTSNDDTLPTLPARGHSPTR